MKNTRELLTSIRRMSSPDSLQSDDYKDIDFPTYINGIMKENNIKPTDLILHLNIEKSYLYQILKGRRAPGREFLIDFSIYIGLTLDDTQRLLKIGQRQPLYPRNRKDAAIIYAITHKMNLEKYKDFISTMENSNDG